MKKNYLFTGLSFILLILLLPQLLVQTSCANIVPPEGGARDSLPPVLTRVTPPDLTRNFADDRITFSFDEYIDLDNAQQNMIVSPIPQNMPTVTRKLNSLTVKLRDSLEENTTYSINFGNSIKDVNEGNILKNFTYTFSTGRYIDSLQLTGSVLLAQTGEVDTTLTVMLHRDSKDSAVIKERPRYVTKLDGRGRFTFNNLPPGTYYIYALKDAGGSYRFLNPNELFAFYDSAVSTTARNDSIRLYAYAIEKKEQALPTVTTSRNQARAAEKRLKFQTNLQLSKQDLLTNFMLTFDTPLKNFDSSKVHFSTDTTFTPVTGYHWELDSLKKTAALHYTWKENTQYNLILEKEFASDTLNQQLLKGDTLTFSTMAIADYGKLVLRFRNLDLSKNPVLLFVQNNAVVKSIPLTSELLSQPLFIPGEYNLRLLYDANKNGVWDPGVFFGTRRQPELVKPIQRKITIKANYGEEIPIAL